LKVCIEKIQIYKLTIQTRQHKNNFDFLRLIGASTVVINHAYPLLTGNVNHDWLEKITGTLGTGTLVLDIFFVISGYLITQSLLSKKNAIDFFVARCKRIFPALFLSIILSVFVVGLLATKLSAVNYFQNVDTWKYFISISVFKLRFSLPEVFTEPFFHSSSINGSIWTLAYEWVMYGAIFLFGTIGILKSNWKYLVLHVVIISVMIFYDQHPQLTTVKLFGIESTRIVNLYVFFMMGNLLFIFKDKFTVKWFHVVLLFIIWAISWRTNFSSVISFFFIPIFTIWFSFLPITFLQKLTKSGDYSYGIYVYSFPIQQLIIFYSSAQINVWQLLFLSFALTLPIAILSYHFIELPIIKLNKKATNS
jgi:peptidoglycan/LPS O-acetylase OafA/YrhL